VVVGQQLDERPKTKDELLSSFVARPSSTLVVGLGNPILGDDGVGWRVAEEVRKQLGIADCPGQSEIPNLKSEIEVDCAALGGLSLMERLVGYDRAIVIDALYTGQQPVGSVHRFSLDDLPDLSAGHTTAAHDTSLQTALNMGRAMGVHLPEQVTVVAVEARSVHDFSEELTPPVAAAVPRAVELVLESLRAPRPV
jgi:hydrogenase maturation protease